MNLQKRFLFLFADYREALARAQRAEDEALQLRHSMEEIQGRIDALTKTSIDREREMTDRVMAMHYGQRVLKPHEAPTPVKRVETETPAEWSKRKWNEFLKAAKEREDGQNAPSAN
jgi:hypothetical protein